MPPLNITGFAVKSSLLIALTLVVGPETFAQNRWLDSVPQQQVGCIKGTGNIETTDFALLLREKAKTAGATEIGIPFLTRLEPTGNNTAIVKWEACSVIKGPAQQSADFQRRVFAESAGAFQVCAGSDAKACAADLATWLKTKVSDFSTPIRVIPLLEYTPEQLQATKSSIPTLLTRTVLLEKYQDPSNAPDLIDDLDKQLDGSSAVTRKGRPLQTDQVNRLPAGDGKRAYTGVLVFVPLTPEQKTAVGAQ